MSYLDLSDKDIDAFLVSLVDGVHHGFPKDVFRMSDLAWVRFQHDQCIKALGERPVPVHGVMLAKDGTPRTGRVHWFRRVHEPENDFDGSGMAACGAYTDIGSWDIGPSVQAQAITCWKCLTERA